MRIRARADWICLDSEESGWVLDIRTDEGDDFLFDIHGLALEFAGSEGLRSLLEWRAEGEEVRQLVGQTTVDEMLDDDDPDSEGYGERMREGADLARKARRENR